MRDQEIRWFNNECSRIVHEHSLTFKSKSFDLYSILIEDYICRRLFFT